MKLTEDEIQEHYQSREWIFGDSDENADLEMEGSRSKENCVSRSMMI